MYKVDKVIYQKTVAIITATGALIMLQNCT